MAHGRGPIAGLAAAAALCADAPPAAASVRIDDDRIVVRAQGASAVIEREPFRLAFGDVTRSAGS
jgi:hypothetical protein